MAVIVTFSHFRPELNKKHSVVRGNPVGTTAPQDSSWSEMALIQAARTAGGKVKKKKNGCPHREVHHGFF
jgi:hypothetical protein